MDVMRDLAGLRRANVKLEPRWRSSQRRLLAWSPQLRTREPTTPFSHYFLIAVSCPFAETRLADRASALVLFLFRRWLVSASRIRPAQSPPRGSAFLGCSWSISACQSCYSLSTCFGADKMCLTRRHVLVVPQHDYVPSEPWRVAKAAVWLASEKTHSSSWPYLS